MVRWKLSCQTSESIACFFSCAKLPSVTLRHMLRLFFILFIFLILRWFFFINHIFCHPLGAFHVYYNLQESMTVVNTPESLYYLWVEEVSVLFCFPFSFLFLHYGKRIYSSRQLISYYLDWKIWLSSVLDFILKILLMPWNPPPAPFSLLLLIGFKDHCSWPWLLVLAAFHRDYIYPEY